MNLGLGLNIAKTKSGGGLLTPFDTATPTAGYSLRPLSIGSYGKPVVKVRRSSDNTEKDFKSFEITNGALESWIYSANESPANYGSGAAAAYSLRYVSDSYTGSVVKVRRSIDNTEQDFTPSEITDGTLLAWVGTTVSDHGYVTTWYDQSVNSNDATQSTAASQPKIVDAGVLVEENGKPAVDFDGSNDYLQTSVFTASTQPITRILVAKQNGSGYLTDGSSTNRGVIGSNPSSSVRRIFAGTSDDYAVNITGNQELLYALFDGANSELFVNSSGLGAKSVGTGGLDRVTIGTIYNASLSTTFVDAQIQEIMIYASDQSVNRTTIEANINKYYDIYTPTVNGFVSKWYDQFGSNDATNSTAAEQPKIWDSTTGLLTEGGRPAIEFDGVDDGLTFDSSVFDIGNLSSFAVGKYNVLDATMLFAISGTTSDKRWYAPFASNTEFRFGYADSANALSVTGNTNRHIFTMIAGSTLGNMEAWIDNFSIGTDTLDSGIDAINGIGNLDGSFNADCNVQEILIYASDQSANKEAIEDNINVYYVLYGLKHYRQRVLADSGTFALEGRDALVYNSVTIPEMPSLICSCDAYKATKLYNINPA